jgi:hypothetical protein
MSKSTHPLDSVRAEIDAMPPEQRTLARYRLDERVRKDMREPARAAVKQAIEARPLETGDRLFVVSYGGVWLFDIRAAVSVEVLQAAVKPLDMEVRALTATEVLDLYVQERNSDCDPGDEIVDLRADAEKRAAV